MINNFKEKLDAGLVTVEFGVDNNVVFIERKFDENNGLPTMGNPIPTNSKHVEDLIADNDRVIAPYLQKATDLNDILAVVKTKEAEIEAANQEAAAKLKKGE